MTKCTPTTVNLQTPPQYNGQFRTDAGSFKSPPITRILLHSLLRLFISLQHASLKSSAFGILRRKREIVFMLRSQLNVSNTLKWE